MSSNNKRTTGNSAPIEQPAQAAPDMQSIARRRAIFSGLGKGAALVGATVPLKSLATSSQRMRLKKTDNRYYQCSVSGNTSVMVSQGTASTTPCGARPASDYACSGTDLTNTETSAWPKWPSKSVKVNRVWAMRAVCYSGSTGTAAYLPTAPFSTVFGWGSTTTIGSLVHTASTRDGDEAQWVVAALNATKYASTFPYDVSDVWKFSQLNYAQRNAALAFFRDWLNKAPIA